MLLKKPIMQQINKINFTEGRCYYLSTDGKNVGYKNVCSYYYPQMKG